MFKGNSELLKLTTEKITAEAKLEAALQTLADKSKEIDRLQLVVDRLQDALVATTAPRAYEDRRADTAVTSVQDAEDAKRNRRQAELNGELLYRMEEPTFKDADDMISMLTGGSFESVMNTKSVHENSESQ